MPAVSLYPITNKLLFALNQTFEVNSQESIGISSVLNNGHKFKFAISKLVVS